MLEIQTKWCSKCKQLKSFSEFYKAPRHKDGLTSACKICTNNRIAKYQQGSKYKKFKKHYHQSEKYKILDKKRRIIHIARIRAERTIGSAVYHGKLKSAKCFKCNHCPAQAQEYHHHFGYAKEHRLDVVPVCRKCHKIIHQSAPDHIEARH